MPRIFWMWTTSSPLNLKFWHHWTLNFPTRRKFIVLPSHYNTQWPPPSLNEWRPPSLDEQLASSLSRAGILPLALASPPLALASSLSRRTVALHPLSTNGFLPHLTTASSFPWPMGSPASMNSFPPPSTNSSFPWRMASPLPQQTVSPFPQRTASSLPRRTVSSLNKCSPPMFQVDWLWVNTTVIVRVIGYTPSYYT